MLSLVTVVTPSYNQGRVIRATIESVLKQDYPRIEYLVIDGGSTAETVSILRESSDRLRWVSEPDHGQAHAINKGWRGARGSILAYLNSDDVYLPGAVAQAVAALDAHTPRRRRSTERVTTSMKKARSSSAIRPSRSMPPQTPRVASSRERNDQRYLRRHRPLLYHDGARRSTLGGLLVPRGVSVNLSPMGEAHDP